MGISKNGFTLMEMVMVIAIIGVISLVVIPKFNDYYAIDLRSAVKTLAADIKFAQSRAIAERVRYGVYFNSSSESYTVYRGNVSTPADDLLKPGRPMRRTLEGMDIESAEFDGGASVEFDALGIPRGSSGSELSAAGLVVLNCSGNVDTLKIYPLTGKVEF